MILANGVLEAGLIGGAIGLVGACIAGFFRWYYRSSYSSKWVLPNHTDRWVMAFVVFFFAVLILVGYFVIKSNS